MTPFADDMSARGFFHVMGNTLEFPITQKAHSFSQETRFGKDKTDEKTGSADKL